MGKLLTLLLVSMVASGGYFASENIWKLQPKLRFEFTVADGQLDSLQGDLRKFASGRSLAVTDNGAQLPPKENRKIFFLVLTSVNDDLEIYVEDTIQSDHMRMYVYAKDENSKRTKAVVDDLSMQLKRRWPDFKVYAGP